MKRSALKPSGKPLKRTRLRPASKATIAARPDHDAIRAQVFERDGHRCQFIRVTGSADDCFGALTAHHIRKASTGGDYDLDNLVTLCAHHNTWVEDHPAEARRFDLVRRSWECPPGQPHDFHREPNELGVGGLPAGVRCIECGADAPTDAGSISVELPLMAAGFALAIAAPWLLAPYAAILAGVACLVWLRRQDRGPSEHLSQIDRLARSAPRVLPKGKS